MFRPMQQDDFCDLYDKYLDPDYEIFFRHFEPFLDEDNFLANLKNLKVLAYSRDVFMMMSIYNRAKMVDVSLIIDKDKQHQGMCVPILEEICKYLFWDFALNQMTMHVASDDFHTNEIAKKGGFVLEATYKNSCFFNHKFHDENRYVYTREMYVKNYGS